MPLPTLADCFLARLKWVSASAQRPATNGLVFHDDAGGQTAGDLWTDLNDNVTQNMWDLVGGSASVTEVGITPLDASSATEIHATASPAKWSGGSADVPILQGSCVVSFQTIVRGPVGRGRIYLPFVPEAGQASGTLTAGSVTTMQTAWNAFKTAMATDGWGMRILNTGGVAYPVSTITVRPYLKTQRRRARR